MPQDVAWSIPYDTTPFVEVSVEEVVKTLVEAMVLVFLVMFLFLQNWRATLIPTLVVPIALAGACLGLWLFGFSINVLSLFGMVLAIGILVDDAIVVIENVERIMREEGLGPLAATRKAMDQITGAIIGITLVLIAVFVPMAFFPGSTGGIYRQFSVTLAISIFFSAVLALSLTPALCATFLRAQDVQDHDGDADSEPDETLLPEGWRGKVELARRKGTVFFNRFNQWFARMTEKYGRTNEKILAQADARTGGLPVARCDYRTAVCAPARRVPADRGPGLCNHRRSVACGIDAGAARRGDRTRRRIGNRARKSNA